MYYVYRFLDKSRKILYVGKTNDINTRINNHIKYGHLSMECYIQVDEIEYIELPTKLEMDVAEIYLINFYKPPYNKEDLIKEQFITRLENLPKWQRFTYLDFKTVISYKNKMIKSEASNKAIQKKYARLLHNSKSASQTFEQITSPYYLTNLNSRLHYIGKVLDTTIIPLKDIQALYNYKEVITLLWGDPSVTYRAMNRDLHIIAYREGDTIYFEEKGNKISECGCSRYIVKIKSNEPYDIGSYNLAGIVPFLHYTVNV